MYRIILERLLMSVPLLLLVTGLVFILQSFLPGDVANYIAGIDAPPEQVQKIREELRLDEPVVQQYTRWLGAALQGDLGKSLVNGEPVVKALSARLEVTLSLVGLMTVLSLVVGVLVGIVSATSGPGVRAFTDVVSILGLAVPNYFLGIVLAAIFAVWLGWLPANGYIAPRDGIGGWLWAMTLPVLTLAFWAVTSIAKQTRDGMMDALSMDFVRNLRANGLSERAIIYRHALRNASLPVLAVSGQIFVAAVGSSVIVEQVFGLPGLGGLAVSATATNDIPLIQGVTLYFTIIVIVVNLTLDILYSVVNPRVRTGR